MLNRFRTAVLLSILLGVTAWPQGKAPDGVVNLTVPGQTRWLDTGVDLAMRQVVDITVQGKIQWNKDGAQMCGPTGAVPYTRWGHKPVLAINTGALIGKIGSDSTDYFYIGAGQKAVAFAAGRLFVGINDDNVLDNDGAFTISIRPLRDN